MLHLAFCMFRVAWINSPEEIPFGFSEHRIDFIMLVLVL